MKISGKLRARILSYSALLILCTVASFFPNARLWGLNAWGYFPAWVTIAFAAAGLLPVAIALKLNQASASGSNPSHYWLGASAVLVLALGSFYLFRLHTYFLGDGYTLISLLTAETPIIKWRNYGGSILQEALLPIFNGTPKEAAVLSYQVVAWLAGALFVTVAAIGSYLLTDRLFDRLALLLGLCTGGFSLLFFGYVENYALFVVSVLIYCLLGIGIIRRRIGPWWILLPQLAVVFFHIFGLVLIPATVYVIVHSTRWLTTFMRRVRPYRVVIAIGLFVLGLAAYALVRNDSIELQTVVLPFVSDRFTTDNYTLLSVAHELDLANLLFVLCPGAVLALVGFYLDRKTRRKVPEGTGLIVLVAGLSLGVACFVDPKLGMPRDWDLFAFAGVPIVLLSFLYVLGDTTRARNRVLAILMIGIAVVVLGGRVAVGSHEEAAVQQTRAYMYLDPVRNHNSWTILVDYYLERGDSASADKTTADRLALLPEEVTLIEARQYWLAGDTRVALNKLASIQERYRGIGSYHSHLGAVLLSMRRIQDAFDEISIALAMNPYEPNNLANMGSICLMRAESANAESYWRKAMSINPGSSMSLYGITMLSDARGDFEEVKRLYSKGANLPGMQTDYFRMVAEASCAHGDFPMAARALEKIPQHGADSSYVIEMHRRWPVLDSL